MSEFWARYKDPRWQRRRLEIMQRADFACEECGTREKTLNVHHKLYRKGAMPWEYSDHELKCLCEDCHEEEHHWKKRLEAAVAEAGLSRIEEIVGFAEGVVATDHVFSDYEGPPRNRVWKLDSWGHAFGFLCRMRGLFGTDIERILNETPELTEQSIWDLQMDAYEKEKASRGEG